jgi:4-oxalocrotonate tautomerase
MAEAKCGEAAVSVIEDIAPDDWTEKVYKPDILGNWNHVYKKPRNDPL